MVIVVRKAVKEDLANILGMIQELADFEKMPDGPKLTVEDLIRDGGFDETQANAPLFFCFIAEDCAEPTNSEENKNRQPFTSPVGFALYFYAYSTWEGKVLFMEDIYVKPDHRQLGVGKQLFNAVIAHAKASGCVRLDFHVLDWNPARKFYEKFNALSLTAAEGWHLYRINRSNF